MGRPLTGVLLLSLLTLSLLSVPVEAKVQAVSSESVVAHVPRLTMDDEEISSYGLRVMISLGEDLNLDFLVFEQRNGKRGLIVVDPTDSTPLLAILNDKMMVYDPVQGKVELSDGFFAVQLSSEAADDGMQRMNFSLNMARKSEEIELHHTLIDIKSFVVGKSFYESTAKEKKGGIYEAVSVSESGALTAARFEMDGKRKKLSQLSIFKRDDETNENMYMSFRLINFNKPISEKWLDMPIEELISAGVVVEKELKIPEGEVTLNTVIMSMMLRVLPVMVKSDDLKEKLGGYLPENFDWEEFKTRDKKISHLLRTIFVDIQTLTEMSAP